MVVPEVEPISQRPERPITSRFEDKLERHQFVSRLINALVDGQSNRSTGVIVGITGPWGSGKSSILNLLKEQIQARYNDALVVRFDPWLISGRTDLITEFISELRRQIRSESKLKKQVRAIGNLIGDYGSLVTPLGSFWSPGADSVLSAVFKVVKKMVSANPGIVILRKRIHKSLQEIQVPIVVLIDEVDRVEDEEIRTIAQLVRSVMDFPGISYVLAYDEKRVIEALGQGVSSRNRKERGQSYIEKIVQMQFPIPVVFSDEIGRMILAELSLLKSEIGLPDDFQSIDRYKTFIELITEKLVETPRDVIRLVGNYRILAGMLKGEVDWLDLLGYCVLLTKTPALVEVMRSDPAEFSDEIYSAASSMRRMTREGETAEERLAALLPVNKERERVGPLLGFIFPLYKSKFHYHRQEFDDRPLALCHRRPLLTTLRLGLLPGAFSRSDVERLTTASVEEVERTLRHLYEKDTIGNLIEKLDDLYGELVGIDHIRFWSGVSAFLKKSDCKWIQTYSPMHELISAFGDVLQGAMRRNASMARVVKEIFVALIAKKENELTAWLLRRHMFAYGLFGLRTSPGFAVFLDVLEVESLALSISRDEKKEHLLGNLIPCRWDLYPVYTMIDTGLWDEECREALNRTIESNEALDGLCLMMYGSGYTTERNTVAKICNYEKFIDRVKERLQSTDIHESVGVALRKAVDPVS